MPTVRKFLFETNFDETGDGPSRAAMRKANADARDSPAEPPPAPEPTFSSAEMEETRSRAHAAGLKEGIAKGRAEAEARVESQIAAALATINVEVPRLTAKVSLDRTSVLAEASTLALAILRKMLPEFTRRGALTEIEAVIQQCLTDQRREPRLIARVPLELLPQMEAKIAGIAAGNGFEGRIDLLADPDLSGASCRIEWADGRLERYDQAMWAQVSAALDRCLTVLGIAPPEQADLTTEATGGADAGLAAESPRSE